MKKDEAALATVDAATGAGAAAASAKREPGTMVEEGGRAAAQREDWKVGGSKDVPAATEKAKPP